MLKHPKVRMKADVVIWLMTVEETRLEKENNSSIYPHILANTCPEGRFKHLKIENHAALGSPPHPLETVSQTAVVIGSERFFYYIFIFYAPAPLNEFFLCEANILWCSLRKSWILERLHLLLFLLLLLFLIPPPPLTCLAAAACGLPRHHQRWNAHKSAIQRWAEQPDKQREK